MNDKNMPIKGQLHLCRNIILVALIFCSLAFAQDRAIYQVHLEVVDGQLTIVSPSNCDGKRLYGEVCAAEGQGSDIVFSLGSDSGDWKLSTILIRDPALNWRDDLPERTKADFGQFSNDGVFQGAPTDNGELKISDENRHSLAVQYKITAKHRQSGEYSEPSHSVIENGGGAPSTRD